LLPILVIFIFFLLFFFFFWSWDGFLKQIWFQNRRYKTKRKMLLHAQQLEETSSTSSSTSASGNENLFTSIPGLRISRPSDVQRLPSRGEPMTRPSSIKHHFGHYYANKLHQIRPGGFLAIPPSVFPSKICAPVATNNNNVPSAQMIDVALQKHREAFLLALAQRGAPYWLQHQHGLLPSRDKLIENLNSNPRFPIGQPPVLPTQTGPFSAQQQQGLVNPQATALWLASMAATAGPSSCWPSVWRQQANLLAGLQGT
jgi:hypothetical protein